MNHIASGFEKFATKSKGKYPRKEYANIRKASNNSKE